MAIVKNNSKGYGYKYASLSDIAAQGFEIPKMKTESEYEREYVYYYDADLKDWIRGAEIVIPEAKGMNKAQIYGSALTYARRYTTLMALQLCCGDDDVIENLNEDGTSKADKKEEPKKEYDPLEDDGTPATPKQLEVLTKLNQKVIDNIVNHFGLNSIDEISKAQASETLAKFIKKKNEINNQ